MDRTLAVQGIEPEKYQVGKLQPKDFVRYAVRDAEDKLVDIFPFEKFRFACKLARQLGGRAQAVSLKESKEILRKERNNFQPLPDRRTPEPELGPQSTLRAANSYLRSGRNSRNR